MLRYQRTGDVTFDRSDINLSSWFSERVLDHVLARREAVGTA